MIGNCLREQSVLCSRHVASTGSIGNTGWPKKNRYGHFHSYLTTAFEFFDTLSTKKITDKFLINFEKMAVRRGLSKFLHGLKVDAIFKWINRV